MLKRNTLETSLWHETRIAAATYVALRDMKKKVSIEALAGLLSRGDREGAIRILSETVTSAVLTRAAAERKATYLKGAKIGISMLPKATRKPRKPTRKAR